MNPIVAGRTSGNPACCAPAPELGVDDGLPSRDRLQGHRRIRSSEAMSRHACGSPTLVARAPGEP